MDEFDANLWLASGNRNLWLYGGATAALFVVGLLMLGTATNDELPEPMAEEVREFMRRGRPSIAERNAIAEAEEPAAIHAPGAYYPEPTGPEAASPSIAPLVVATVGGGIVFGLVGVGAFWVLGGRRRREEPKPTPTPVSIHRKHRRPRSTSLREPSE